MINILSLMGMSTQSEVCLWTLLGLVRTIFDATLFKVNANLKQVWQMNMPQELSMSVQRALRMMISGVMLAKCFTVYVYLATYIILLYPVFLEERPILVLPWLLLSAFRNLLCELMCLTLGLGTCVLLGPARPPCIKFLIVKFISITPAFYMWMLIYSYYHILKVTAAFNTFPAVFPADNYDYGLELAVRRRRTKSLLGEDVLRKKLGADFYRAKSSIIGTRPKFEICPVVGSTITNSEDIQSVTEPQQSGLIVSTLSRKLSELRTYEDWCGNEVMIPRDADRILEQIVVMLLRIAIYINKEGKEGIDAHLLNSSSPVIIERLDCTAMTIDDTETPALVGSEKVRKISYLYNYPQIFQKNKKQPVEVSEQKTVSIKTDPQTSQPGCKNVRMDKNKYISITLDEKTSSQYELITKTKEMDETIKDRPITSSENKNSLENIHKISQGNESVVEFKCEDNTSMYDVESVECILRTESMNQKNSQSDFQNYFKNQESRIYMKTDSDTNSQKYILNIIPSSQESMTARFFGNNRLSIDNTYTIQESDIEIQRAMFDEPEDTVKNMINSEISQNRDSQHALPSRQHSKEPINNS